MPTRILRDGILTSDRVNKLNAEEERLYRRLMSVVDDFGRFDGRYSIILAACFPLKLDKIKESDVQQWVEACVKAKLIMLYVVDGKQYVVLIDFRQHIRAKRSKYPEPCNADALHLRNTCSAHTHEDEDEDEDGDGDGDGRSPPPKSELLAFDAGSDPVAEFQKAWESLPEDIPKIAKWNTQRQKLFKARMKDEFFIKNWRTALKKVSESKFLRGGNDRGWTIDVDFFLKETSFTKIMEGKYDGREKQKSEDPNLDQSVEYMPRPSELYREHGRFDPKDCPIISAEYPEEAAQYAKMPQKPKIEVPI